MYQAYKLPEGAINFEIIESENKNKALLYELDNKKYYKPLVVRKHQEVQLLSVVRDGQILMYCRTCDYDLVKDFYDNQCVKFDVLAPVLIIVNVTE